MTPSRLGTDSLGAASYPAIQLLQDRLPVLVALLVVANLPELFGRERPKALVDLFHGQLVVALDGELSIPKALLGVRERDVEKLRIAAHDLLGHLLEGLLLLLGLLLEGLLLGLGLLHPLLGRLLDRLLLLLGLSGEVGTGGVEQLHVGVHQLLGHLLGVLLLLFDLLGEGLHRAEPLSLGSLRIAFQPATGVPIHHAISSRNYRLRKSLVYPYEGFLNLGPYGGDLLWIRSEPLFSGVRGRVILRTSALRRSRKLSRKDEGGLPLANPLPVTRVHRRFEFCDVFGDPLQGPRPALLGLHLVLVALVIGVPAPLQQQRVDRPRGLVRLALAVFVVGGDRYAFGQPLGPEVLHHVLVGVPHRGQVRLRGHEVDAMFEVGKLRYVVAARAL